MTSLPRSTPDICDGFPEAINAIELQFQHYGKNKQFYGPVVTVKCFEDNSVVKALVNEPGQGQVLVVDGGASFRRALLGDMLAEAALKNGWAGLVINGCIRDVEMINEMAIGVKALGSIPVKTDRRGEGQQQVPISFGNVTINPGMHVYADENGVIVAQQALQIE